MSEWDDLEKKLEEELQKTKDFASTYVYSVATHAANRSIANAPILKGHLRAAIHATPPKTSGDNVTSTVEVSGVPYALKQHEELTPAGPLNLGPISSQQPGTPEGGVGGKYIERVVKFHLARYNSSIKGAYNSFRLGNTTVRLE